MANMHIKRCSPSLAIHPGNATPKSHFPPVKIAIAVVVVIIEEDDDKDTDVGGSWSSENHVSGRWKHRITPS